MENKKKLLKKYKSYLIPSVAGMWFFSIYTMVDGIFVSRGVGVEALSAVNISLPFVSLLFALAMLLSIGSLNIITYLRGKEENECANKHFSYTIFISAFIGLLITFLASFNMDSIVSFLGADEGLKPLILEYLNIIVLFAPAFILTYVFEMLIKADGYPKIGLIFMAVSALINIFLDYLLVIRLQKGLWGAAIATGIAQTIPTIGYFLHFLSEKSNLKFRNPIIPLSQALDSLIYGLPAALSELSVGFIIFIFNLSITKYIGGKGLVAFSVIMYIFTLVVNTMLAINQGSQPLISYYFGMEEGESLKKLRRYMFSTVAILSVGIFTIIQTFPGFIVSIFIDSSEIEIISFTVSKLKIFSSSFLILGFNMAIGAYMTAVRRPVVELIVTILRGYVVISLFLFLVPKFLGPETIWWMATLSEVLCLIFSIHLFKYYSPKE